MPSTSQHIDTADSVASVPRHRETGQSLCIGHQNALGKWLSDDDEEKENKTKMSGKVDDTSAGNTEGSMRMIHLGATLSTVHQTATAPPIILVGGVAPAPTPAVGGMGGHMKLEPPAKFTGKGFPTVRDWLEETANWLELSPRTPAQ